ncbi:hypothetical protein JCM8115_004510 [Rhodotorula mucilaginosa]|uniref:HECT-type E3 ubiquitin transferase n=1 Tax=Rhodotorula mucilaginosa TaxID=5537 RepID=A0A9P6W290_RHOMI|nr:putative E3 ubiquitin-protein ligase [Rhodotorula mucilaginosa]TKA52694.1 hypothetical protein B0A53_04147 [Rhodotorula sp. CCFEE 5036]
MADSACAYEPPAAVPVRPVASTSTSSSQLQPPPLSSSPWTGSGSFYAFGSGSPRSLHSRKAPPFKGRSYTAASASSSPRQTPPPSRPASPAVLMTTARCCCCGTELKYPRASPSFRCTVCDQICDLSDEARRGKAPEGVPVPQATPISEAEWLNLLDSPDRDPEAASDLAQGLDDVTLEDYSTTPSGAPSRLPDLLTAVDTAFSNLPSLEASFRPSSSTSTGQKNPRKRVPSWKTLRQLSDAATSRPAVVERMRERVEAILQRPGPSLLDSDGTWLIVLFENPVFTATAAPDSEARHRLQARLIGLVSRLPNTLHHALVTYLSSPTYPRPAFLEKVEFVCSFLSHRIALCVEADRPPTAYVTDWQVQAAARVASLLFAANEKLRRVPLTAFYVTLIDSLGPAALFNDFETWEATRETFSLCQYPFLLSLGAKILLLTYDGEREMVERTNEAYRANLSSEETESPLLVLNIRRDHLVADSLQQIAMNHRGLTKPLRIKWEDEEGIDAGGLRKEWFLLLCRKLFDPQFGMFLVDEESQYVWFNPAAVGMEDDFWLVGVTTGLALFNGANLDIPLPPVTYKLLAAASTSLKLSDLADLNPSLARGLDQLLNHPAEDVESTFCRTFVGQYEAWGEVVEVDLVENGSEVPVTGQNRQDYVDLMVEFLLVGSVSSQFASFARGFSEVCAGNALSLFRAEELELVIRGSPEELDIEALRAVTIYDGFSPKEPAIEYFWSAVAGFSPTDQRRLLAFITASDRLPATGITSLELKLQCLGDDSDRYPQSHTCFNTLSLYRYSSLQKMERMLRRSFEDSEGFGLR